MGPPSAKEVARARRGRGAIDLARGGDLEARQAHDAPRDLEPREHRPERGLEGRVVGPVVGDDDRRLDALTERVVGDPEHARGLDAWHALERRLDLGGVDVLAAAHDEVGAPREHVEAALGV